LIKEKNSSISTLLEEKCRRLPKITAVVNEKELERIEGRQEERVEEGMEKK
jgi:hypothetical protein